MQGAIRRLHLLPWQVTAIAGVEHKRPGRSLTPSGPRLRFSRDILSIHGATVKRLCIAALLAGTSLQAHALGRLADVSIIDRDTGSMIATHYYRGEYWIAGRPGARYAIAIRNHLGERVLAVTAVDGVNVISGDTASWDQTGYIFGSGESYQITGWRKSNAEVAAFEFTAAPSSYA